MNSIRKTEPVISLRNFSLWSGSHWVLRSVSLAVPPGSFCVLLGANGAGKSSLLKAMAGVLQSPWESFGRLNFQGTEVQPLALRGASPSVSWLPQSLSFSEDLNVREFLWLKALSGADCAKQRETVSWAVEVFGLQPLLEKRLSALSGGQWQRVRLARALRQDASVFLWDEPDTALDEAWRRVLWRALLQRQGQGATIVLALHRFGDVRDFVGSWFGLESGYLVFAEERPGIFPQRFVDRLFLEKGLTR